MPSPPLVPSGSSDARWEALTRAAVFYVATFAADGRLTFINRTPDPSDHVELLVGHHISDLLPLGDGLDVRDAIEEAIGDDRPLRLEIPASLGGGATRWLELHLTPIKQDGHPVAVLALGLDVTESRQAAIELRMSVNALHRVIESREQLEADLHDDVLQSLYGVGLQLEAARAGLAAGEAIATDRLERALEQLKDTMRGIRRFIAEDQSSPPGGVRWDGALKGVLRGLEVEGGPRIDVTLDTAAVQRVSPADQSDLVSIAREAVSNAVRHARATRVAVRLLDDGANLRLEVEDDGHGFNAAADPGGVGFLTMTRRAGRMGGILTIQTSATSGTLLRLDLPAPETATGV